MSAQDDVAAQAASAASAFGDAPDPMAVEWVQQLQRWGWTVDGIGRGYLRLGWPPPFRALTGSPASLRVPVARSAPEFDEMFAVMSEALGAICWMAAVIRKAEYVVHTRAVADGWERERPVRWPTTEGFWPQAPDGSEQ